MARFLSPPWFEEVYAATPGEAAGADDPTHRVVLEQVVTGTPDGEVRYRVVVDGGKARITPAGGAGGPGDQGGAGADLTITTDWPTACAIARGRISTQRALLDGRLRCRGNLTRLAGHQDVLAGLDPVPAGVRQSTTYET